MLPVRLSNLQSVLERVSVTPAMLARQLTGLPMERVATVALVVGVLVPSPSAPVAYAQAGPDLKIAMAADKPAEALFEFGPSCGTCNPPPPTGCGNCNPPPPTEPGQIAAVTLPTSSGTNVVVHPSSTDPASLQSVTVKFAHVSAPGLTTIGRFSTISAAPPPTGGFVASNLYFDVATTAAFSGPIDLELPYDPASPGPPNSLEPILPAIRVVHYENGAWVDRTTAIDPVRQVVTGRIPSLSPFAVLTTKAQLTVTRGGSGTGTVTSSIAGITCGADCTEMYSVGSQITLSVVPAPGSTFDGWSGACTGRGTCQVTIDAVKAITATFQRVNVGVGVGQPPGAVLPNGDRVLTATLTARAGCGSINRIQFGTPNVAFGNARVAISAPSGGPNTRTTGFTYTPPAGTTSVSLTIERVVPSGGGTVSPILFYDGCGEWRTMVGGGPRAFQ